MQTYPQQNHSKEGNLCWPVTEYPCRITCLSENIYHTCLLAVTNCVEHLLHFDIYKFSPKSEKKLWGCTGIKSTTGEMLSLILSDLRYIVISTYINQREIQELKLSRRQITEATGWGFKGMNVVFCIKYTWFTQINLYIVTMETW